MAAAETDKDHEHAECTDDDKRDENAMGVGHMMLKQPKLLALKGDVTMMVSPHQLIGWTAGR